MKYYELYGTVNVPNRSYNYSIPLWERRLAQWCNTQRQKFKKGNLKQWRYDKLINAGFVFEQNGGRFEQRFADFLKFKEKYGHVFVPVSYNEYPGLGLWARYLRSRPISAERKARLNAVGFVWNPTDENWQKKFRELIAFKNKFGHMKVLKTDAEYRKLAAWISQMRWAKRNGKGYNLKEEQIKQLDSIGFDWEPVKEDWEGNMKKLLLFISQFGHCYVPIKLCKIEGLGSWVNRIRKNKHKLSAEKIASLDALGFEWDSDVAYRLRNNIKPKKK